MQFFKGHIWGVLAMALLSIFSTESFADDNDVDCINYDETPDVRCKYGRIWSTRTGQLYVVDSSSPLIKEFALHGKDFFVYLPDEVSSDSLRIANGDEEIRSMSPVRSSEDSGLVNLSIRADYPQYNYRIGTVLDESDPNPMINLVYNFYVPQLEFSIEGKVISKESVLGYEVGDTVLVNIRAVIPIGPQKGLTDASLKQTYHFSTEGQNKHIQFLRVSDKKSLKLSDGSIRLNVDQGVGSFLMVADSTVTDGSTFGMSAFIDPHDSTKFIVKDEFPGSLQFADPGFPSLDGAAIFDTDGDGIGDSIATWFSGAVDSVENFWYSWPDDSTFKKYSGMVHDNALGDVYGLPDVSVKLQQDSATGALQAKICSDMNGTCTTLKTALRDSIGAAIQSASLIKGNSKTDTLVLRFNKDLDPSWNEGYGLLLNSKAIDVKAIKKDGKVWTFVVESGTVKVNDMVKIEAACGKDKCPDGILTAADGVPTAANNQEVPVKNAGRVYADNEKNGFYDRDGDGRMDSVSLGFSDPITKEDLKNVELKFYWLTNDGKSFPITVTAEDLVISDDGLSVGYAINADERDIKKMLTSIDSSFSEDGELTYGYAQMVNTITVDGEKEHVVTLHEMHDYMPPVISSTFLSPESFQEMDPDRFRMTFSEPIDYKDMTLSDDCLSFYVDGNWIHLDLGDAEWSDDGRTVTFMMEAGENLSKRMNPADSVRFSNFTSGIKDLKGNFVAQVSPAVMVKGDPRVVMETTYMADLNRAEQLNKNPKSFALEAVTSELNESQKASLGVLMDVGFATIMKEDSMGVSSLDVKNIGVKWELFVYTNLGAYVGSASGTVRCDSTFFGEKTNCLENPKKMYVRWNMRADSGRKVGVGLYLAKFNIKVYGVEEDFKVERVFRWGVSATHR